MVLLKFQQLKFKELNDKVRVFFLERYFFDIEKEKIRKISDFRVKDSAIEFLSESEKSVTQKFNFILEQHFHNLKSFANRPTLYIHKNSGIPLIGTRYFGIIDRNSNMLELKPMTGCNLNCSFCSVDEGPLSNKIQDFVIQEEYLVEETFKIIAEKECDNIEIYINPQGEPLLYAPLANLVRYLKSNKSIKEIVIITNGVLLNNKKAEELINAGVTGFNISLSTLNNEKTKIIYGISFDMEKLKKIYESISKKIKIMFTPVWLKGINDNDIEQIIEFAKKINAHIGIQKFCFNKLGRNPIKEVGWEEFYNYLRHLENKYGIKLVKNLKTQKTKPLKKPFKKGDIVRAQIFSNGRIKNEKLCHAKGRVISLPNCTKTGIVNVRIKRTSYNLFYGEVV